MSNYQNQHLVGQAGVLRVASELLFRGLPVALPAVDTGVDLIAGTSTRLQIKTSRFLHPNGKTCFRLTHGYRLNAQGKTYVAPRNYSEICDFIVLFSVPISMFWIVPAILLDGAKSCSVGSLPATKLPASERDVILRRRRDGESWSSLAESYGMSSGAMRQIVGSPFYGQLSDRSRRSLSMEISQHENDWTLIESHIQVMSGALISSGEVYHS